MEITNYIASGMIEGYLFGLATPEERAEFERRLKLEPELQEEYIKTQHLLSVYTSCFASRFPGEPESLWNIIQAAPQTEKIQISETSIPEKPVQGMPQQPVKPSPEILATKPVQDISVHSEEPVEPIRIEKTVPPSSGFKAWKWVALFAVLMFIGAMALALTYKMDSEQWKEQVNVQKTILDSKSDQLTVVEESHKTDSVFLAFFKQDGVRTMKLSGEEIVMLGWNSNTGKVILWDISFPEPEAGKSYMLWSVKKGKPEGKEILKSYSSPGMIETSLNVKQADQFLITMEESTTENPDPDETIAKSNN